MCILNRYQLREAKNGSMKFEGSFGRPGRFGGAVFLCCSDQLLVCPHPEPFDVVGRGTAESTGFAFTGGPPLPALSYQEGGHNQRIFMARIWWFLMVGGKYRSVLMFSPRPSNPEPIIASTEELIIYSIYRYIVKKFERTA
jgi:hypothetical protein